jgi:D-alanyl-D-alanine carboxypeptidase
MKRIFAICTIVALLFSNILPVNIQAANKNTTSDATNKDTTESSSCWPKGPDPDCLSADSAIVMDLSSGLILYEKNIHKKHYPASITKIMTTLLCLENSSLDETVTFSHNAIYGIERNSSHIGIDVGEQLTMEQCLYGIMLESANEASLGVAEHVAGSIPAFADMMNKKATELGCLNTHFVNPNGLHNDKHYTSAYDMALISRAAMQNSTFRKITSTKRYTIPPTNKQKESRYLRNHHQMLNPYKLPQYEYDYCIGGKTGYTTVAKSTLVTFAEKDGMQLVCVVMHACSPSIAPNEYTDTIKLLNFGFENYKRYNTSTSLNKSELESSPLFTKYNSLFDKENSPLQISNDACVILPVKAKLKDAKKTIQLNSNCDFKKGKNIIGTITYTYEGKTVGLSNIIYNMTDTPQLKSNIPIEKISNTNAVKKANHTSIFIIVGILLAILVLGVILFFVIRSMNNGKHYKSRKSTKDTFDKSFTDFKLK